MDEPEFRRMCIAALEGRLEEPLRAKWEALRLSDPRFAEYYTRLALEHRIATRRLSARVTGTGTASLAGAETRVPSRYFWILGPLVGVVFLLAGGLAMDNYVRYRQRQAENQPMAAGNTAGTSMPGNVPHANQPAGNTPRSNQPPANGLPPQPPPRLPVDPPPTKVDPPPIETLIPLPEPWFVIGDTGVQEVSVLPIAAQEYVKALPGRGLWGGDQVKVGRGEALLRSEDTRLTLGGRGELAILGPRSIKLLRGRLSLRVLEPGFKLECEDAALRLEPGEYVLTGQRGLSEVAVLTGRAEVRRETESATVGRNTLLSLARGLAEQKLEGAALQALRAEAAATVQDYLHWDFETGAGDCDLGALTTGGLDSGFAMQWDKAQSAVGSSQFDPLFQGRKGLRLRAWVNTDASVVDVRARLHVTGGVRAVSLRVRLAPGVGWRLLDVSLEGLMAGPGREESGFEAGANYSGLQFSVPPSADEPMRAFELRIDDVQVYTLR
ncbi:MAG: hypothetical protein IPP14_14475 [Planctomycetes bacterium]|nr:hypothetical protein [Planctomycetota bacterium]